MCGINLILDRKMSCDESPIQRMNQALLHRGPDHQHFKHLPFGDHQVYVGNTRLKVNDPSDGANQPFSSKDGRYCLSFNGEIYNYRALRKELEQEGIVFETQGDTEVLLHWLIQHGADGLHRLNGMFAFAFADTSENELLLARDRHGIKPLYFANTENSLLASSEIKALLTSGLVQKQLNEAQIGFYLAYRHPAKGETFFKDIFEVEPGYVVRIRQNSFAKAPFKLEAISPDGIEEDALAGYCKELLINSLENQLHADVPVGLLLSGGVDSTLLLALVRELGKEKMHSFSIALHPDEGSFGTEDGKFAQKAAVQFGTQHEELLVGKGILTALDEHVPLMSQPIGDSATLLTKLLSQKASEKVKVVMSGAGADELFGGYNRHLAFYKYLQNPAQRHLLPSMRPLGKALPTGRDHPLRKSFRLMKKYLSSIDPDPAKTYHNFLQFEAFRRSDPDSKQEEDWMKWALNLDQTQYLVYDVLALSDEMSMAHSLELRVPYLDNELVSFAQNLDSNHLLSGGKKWILKRVLDDLGGTAFTQRKKEGFGLPTGKWIQEGAFDSHLDFLNRPNHIIFNYLKPSQLNIMLNQHVHKKHDFSLEIWSVVILTKWLEAHFA